MPIAPHSSRSNREARRMRDVGQADSAFGLAEAARRPKTIYAMHLQIYQKRTECCSPEGGKRDLTALNWRHGEAAAVELLFDEKPIDLIVVDDEQLLGGAAPNCRRWRPARPDCHRRTQTKSSCRRMSGRTRSPHPRHQPRQEVDDQAARREAPVDRPPRRSCRTGLLGRALRPSKRNAKVADGVAPKFLPAAAEPTEDQAPASIRRGARPALRSREVKLA